MSPLECDAVRRDVLDAIFDGCEGYLELRALPSRGRRFVALNDVPTTAADFCQSHPNDNLYFGVATRRSDKNGSLANCQHLGAVFVDIDFKDTSETTARKRLAECPCPPSIVIESGGGLQVHFLLKEPLELSEDADDFKLLLRRLATYFDGDMNAAECARILRVPGTLNYKYSPARLVTVTLFEPDRRYNPCDFDEWLPAVVTAQTGVTPVSLAEPLRAGRRNTDLYRTGRALRAKQLAPGSIASTLRVLNAERCEPPLPVDELDSLIAQVVGQPDRPDFQRSHRGGDVVDIVEAGVTKADPAKGDGKATSVPPPNVLPIRPAGSTTPNRTPAQTDVETLLAQCDLATIPAPPSPANLGKLEERLGRLKMALEGADPLRVAAVRAALIVKVRAAKVPSPAALIDSALAPLRKTTTDQHKCDLELFPNDDPWPDPVEGAVLLDKLREVLRQHVVLPAGADVAIPLWCTHTHLMNCWDVSPFLLIGSPVWRCGKSLLADFVAGFSRRALTSSNTSDAALFRCIEKFAPTLVLDEADSWIKMREELRGILNSGHKRTGAMVLRTDGDTHEPRPFSTWTAKVVVLIGRPPATIGDRSIAVSMRRKTKQESVKRIRVKKLRALCEPLRRQCARWADEHREALATAEPELPDALTDRAQDNWEALIAVADEVGGAWPKAARDAALLLSNGAEQEESTGVDLLFDLKSIFDKEKPADFLTTETILDRLCEREDRPWGTWGRQDKPMTPQALARQLKPFGPKPCDKRVKIAVKKGYHKRDFLEAWERYVPEVPNPGSQTATSRQVNKTGGKP